MGDASTLEVPAYVDNGISHSLWTKVVTRATKGVRYKQTRDGEVHSYRSAGLGKIRDIWQMTNTQHSDSMIGTSPKQRTV